MNPAFKTWLSIAMAVVVLLLAGGVTAEAMSQNVLGTITANLGAKRHKAATENDDGVLITSTSYTQVTSTTITVPSTIAAARLVARFSAESRCNGSSGSWCTLRILVNGFETNPVVGTDYAWDSPGDNAGTTSIDRTSGTLLPGTHTVSVEARLVGAATLLSIDDWLLTLELWANPPIVAPTPRREDAPEPDVLTTLSSNKGAKRLKVVSDIGVSQTSSPTFTALTTTTVTIPSAFNTGRIVARFSGESGCTAGTACTVRILVDGVETSPVSDDFAFDVPGGTVFESQSMERTSGTLSPGTHTVVVQWRAVGGGTFGIDDWTLVVAVWRVS